MKKEILFVITLIFFANVSFAQIPGYLTGTFEKVNKNFSEIYFYSPDGKRFVTPVMIVEMGQNVLAGHIHLVAPVVIDNN